MLFKVAGQTGESAFGVDGTPVEHLPTANAPGPWMPAIEGDLAYQGKGYHCADENQLLEWLGPIIYEVEAEGEVLDAPRAQVARKIRFLRKYSTWTDQAARRFAAECAMRVLPLFEGVSQNQAPREAIAKALVAPPNLYSVNPANMTAALEQFAEESEALKTAAEEAAEAVAEQSLAAKHAATAAAQAASAYEPGASAARYAAHSARLARVAEVQAEREWQVKRLLEILNG